MSTRTASRSVSRTTVVPASPVTVFALLADPARHPDVDGSGTVRARLRGPSRLSLGARFGMRMRLGVPYVMTSRVVEFEEDRRIAWQHVGRHVWRWELAPVPEGTRVTETFDWGPSLAPRVLEQLGVPARNARSIELSLARLRDLVSG